MTNALNNSKSDSSCTHTDVSAAPTRSEPKLLVTVATKIDEDRARRFRTVAQASGMTDAQLFRLVLERMDVLFSSWDERVNPRFFIDQFEVRNEQLSLFFSAQHGNLRSKR